jgi:hypothetical protein
MLHSTPTSILRFCCRRARRKNQVLLGHGVHQERVLFSGEKICLSRALRSEHQVATYSEPVCDVVNVSVLDDGITDDSGYVCGRCACWYRAGVKLCDM